MVVTGKGIHQVNRKDQLCYEVRIPEIDDGTIFHISCSNFRVDTAAATPFEDELVANAPPPRARTAAEEHTAIRASFSNVARSELVQEVAELRQQGIEVDDDNEPAPQECPANAANYSTGGGMDNTYCLCPKATELL